MWPQFNSSHAARDAVDRCEPMAVPDLDVIRAAILRRASRTASKVLTAAPPCSHPFPGRMQRAETTADAAEWGHRHTLPPPDLCGPYGGIRGDPWVPTEGYVKSIQKCWWGGTDDPVRVISGRMCHQWVANEFGSRGYIKTGGTHQMQGRIICNIVPRHPRKPISGRAVVRGWAAAARQAAAVGGGHRP